MVVSDGLWFTIIKNLTPFNSNKNKKNTNTHKKPALDNVTKRQQQTCPRCYANLNLAHGEWNSKYCSTCKRYVKPYGKPQ